MFCKNCGNKLEEGSKFCSSCGHPCTIQPEIKPVENVEDNNILLTVRPKFIPITTIASIIPMTAFFTIWCGMFFGAMAFVLCQTVFKFNPSFWPFLVFAIIPIVFGPFSSYYVQAKTYENTVYHFYKTKVEYHEGFLGRDTKTLNYSRVLETELRKGVIQQQYGLGTIVLSAAGVSTTGSGNGVQIKDIENPDKIYQMVKDLVAKNQK